MIFTKTTTTKKLTIFLRNLKCELFLERKTKQKNLIKLKKVKLNILFV